METELKDVGKQVQMNNIHIHQLNVKDFIQTEIVLLFRISVLNTVMYGMTFDYKSKVHVLIIYK